MKIKTNIVIAILILTFFFMCIFSTIFYRDFNRLNEEEFINNKISQLKNRVDDINIETALRIKKISNVIGDIESFIVLEDINIEEYFNKWASENELINNIYYIDEEMNTYIAFEEELIENTIVNDWYFGAKKSDELYFTKVHENNVTHNNVISFSKAIYKGEDFKGVIGIDVQLDYLVKELLEIELENNMGFALYEDEKIVYSNLPNQYMSYIKTKNFNIYVDEIDAYILEIYIEEINLDFIVFLEKYSINSLISKNLMLLIIIGIIYLGFVVILVNNYILKTIFGPMDRLKILIFNIRDGNYDIEDGYYLKDDFNKIYSRFYKLGIYLRSSFLKLSNYKQKLLEDSIKLLAINIKERRILEDNKTSRSKINQSIKVHQSIMESLVDMIWEVNKTGVIINVNEVFLKYMGYSKSEIIGKSIYEFIDSILDEKSFLKVLKSRDYNSIEINFICKDKSIHTLKTSINRIINFENELVEIQAVSIDDSINYLRNNELKNRNRELSILKEISQEIGINLSLEKLYNIIIDKIQLVINADIICIRMSRKNDLNVIKIYDKRNEDDWLRVEKLFKVDLIELNRIKMIKNYEDFNIEDEFLKKYLDNEGKLIFISLTESNQSIGFIIIASKEIVNYYKLSLLLNIANRSTEVINNKMIVKKLGKNYFNTVNALKSSLEVKNKNIYMYSQRISDIAMFIGKKTFLSDSNIDDLGTVGILYNIGIIGIPDYLLVKPFGKMTIEEKVKYSTRTTIGYKILSSLNFNEKIMKAIKLNENDCLREEKNTFDNFEGIICFSKWINKFFVEYIDNNNLEIDEIINCLKENFKHVKCNEYSKLIEKALAKKNKTLIEIIRMRDRGGHHDE